VGGKANQLRLAGWVTAFKRNDLRLVVSSLSVDGAFIKSGKMEEVTHVSYFN